MLRRQQWVRLYGAILVLTCVAMSSLAFADTLQSSNYKFEESAVGTGGMLQSSSANYQAISSTGDIANGNAASANYQSTAGTRTSPDPALTLAITSSAANFGTFTPSTATTATSTFSVINYTTYGYVVQIVGNPPTTGTRSLTAMATPAASNPGTEQFGINLVANTSPTSLGANPDNGQFGFGSAAPGYNTANNYKYVSGDTIAQATKNSGQTNYTISYLVNVKGLTAGGAYTANQSLVVTGTY